MENEEIMKISNQSKKSAYKLYPWRLSSLKSATKVILDRLRMSSINGDHISDKDDKADTSSNKESAVGSRIARDSENGDAVTKELSPDHTCTADKSCSEQEALENKTPSQNEGVDKSIKSPPIDTSLTNNGNGTEKIPDQGEVKDASPTADDNDEWLDILGSGHLKKKVDISFAEVNIITFILQ